MGWWLSTIEQFSIVRGLITNLIVANPVFEAFVSIVPESVAQSTNF